ncbi:Uncharacterised protein [Listeria fleischmannii subsp. fleischmannii]|uniref:Uncharacterized protein n=1 Tax=Listeria fleischmannii subsp. fleischmannii TaxID=1671902 RepID=A0A2X3JC27_9LIST|nr:Uncharacterised protein [Listeria fleischmannii subsp. fleischmannii]
MGDGPPGFRRNFTCSAVLRIHSGEKHISTTGLLPSLAGLSRPLHLHPSFVTPYRVSYNPKKQASWFGPLSVSARRYSGNRFFFLFLQYLDVSVPWVCLPYAMYSHKDTIRLKIVGSPHSEISGSTLTYSSPKHIGVSPRPSSAPSAKASTVRPS